MLPSTCSREALLACPPCPLWNLPLLIVESTLSTSCSRSDPPSLAKARLSPTLTLLPLMIWCFGHTAVFVFLLEKTAPAFLLSAFSVAPFPFRQVQYAQVSLLKPAPFCTLFAGLGSTNKSAISLLFSYYPTVVQSSPPCPLLHLSFYFSLFGRSVRNCLLSSCFIRLQWVPGNSFLPGNDADDELARRGALLALSAIHCSLSPLIYCIASSPFLGLAAYCLIKILRHTGSLDFHRVTCASSTRSLCSLSSTLQRTQPSFRSLSH